MPAPTTATCSVLTVRTSFDSRFFNKDGTVTVRRYGTVPLSTNDTHNGTVPSTRSYADVMTQRAPAGAAVLQSHVTQAITEAVLQEWADNGYARLSMEAVARRAGVGKNALYRRWQSKQEMALAVLYEIRVAVVPTPDTGSLCGDLEALVRAMLSWFSYPRIAPIVADMVAETTRDPSLSDAVERVLRTIQRTQSQPIFDRAIERGELGPDVDQEVILELLASNIYWRRIVRPQTVTDAYIHALINLIQHGLAPVKRQQQS